MKILHLRSSGGFYGAEAVILSLAKEQLRQGVDVVVGVIVSELSREENELIKRCVEDGVPVREFVCRGKIDRDTVREVRRYVIDDHVDVVHSHGYKADLFGFLAGRKLCVKKVSTVHGYIAKSLRVWIYELADRFILKRVFDEIVLVSEEQRRLFKTPKVSVIFNGIDVTNFSTGTTTLRHCDTTKTSRHYDTKALKNKDTEALRHQDTSAVGFDGSSAIVSECHSAPDVFTIGMVGRLSVEKGHIYLLKAFEKLIRTHDTRHMTHDGIKSLRLLVIGDGPLQARLVQLVHRTKILRGKVRFLPAQKDVKKFYGQMDVLVLPSLSEGLPMTLLEGMAMELPVVATRVGGVPDVIKDGFNGFLVEPQDVEGLAEAIKKVINMTHDTGHMTQGEFKDLTKNARETVELHFSTQRMASEYLNVYKNL